MLRAILKRSILAATCVLALGQTANALALSSVQQLDVNLPETAAGKAYKAVKPCPLANSDQTPIDQVNVATAFEVGGKSAASHSNGTGTVR